MAAAPLFSVALPYIETVGDARLDVGLATVVEFNPVSIRHLAHFRSVGGSGDPHESDTGMDPAKSRNIPLQKLLGSCLAERVLA